MRLDSGHDAINNRFQLHHEQVDFLIKWNPRKQNLSDWISKADKESEWVIPREGKRIATFSEAIGEKHHDHIRSCRRVIRIIERTIDKQGQRLLIPDITLEGWWTTLDTDVADVSVHALDRGRQSIQQRQSHRNAPFLNSFNTYLKFPRNSR